MSELRSSILGPVFTIGVICVLSILVAPPLVWAALPDSQPPRPPTATPVLPVRPPTATPAFPRRPPTVTPPPPPPPRPSADGGAIELNVKFLPGSPSEVAWRENLWTMIEWQDGLGNWHAVDDWKANLDEVNSSEGRKIWYVSNDQFGKGPFSWLICPDPDSDPIAASSPFHMPGSAGVIVPVKVAVGKPVAIAPRPTSPAAIIPATGGGAKQYVGLRAALTIFLIGLLGASLLSRDSKHRLR